MRTTSAEARACDKASERRLLEIYDASAFRSRSVCCRLPIAHRLMVRRWLLDSSHSRILARLPPAMKTSGTQTRVPHDCESASVSSHPLSHDAGAATGRCAMAAIAFHGCLNSKRRPVDDLFKKRDDKRFICSHWSPVADSDARYAD